MAEINYQQEGRKILTAFYGAMSALKLYPVENETVQTALTELHGLIERIVRNDGAAEVRVVGDFFFLNENRVRLDATSVSTSGSFSRALQDHGIGTIEVHPGIERSEWAPFLSMILRSPNTDDPFGAFSQSFAHAHTQHIELRAETDSDEVEDDVDALTAARRTYAESVQVAKDALGDTRIGKAVNVRKVKRGTGHRRRGDLERVIDGDDDDAAGLRRIHVHALRQRLHLQCDHRAEACAG